MPFTLDGNWIPGTSKEPKKPVKVSLIKRGKNTLTVILHLSLSEKEMGELASKIKKKLGCGGAIKENTLEIQGDKVEAIRKLLLEIGIHSS